MKQPNKLYTFDEQDNLVLKSPKYKTPNYPKFIKTNKLKIETKQAELKGRKALGLKNQSQQDVGSSNAPSLVSERNPKFNSPAGTNTEGEPAEDNLKIILRSLDTWHSAKVRSQKVYFVDAVKGAIKQSYRVGKQIETTSNTNAEGYLHLPSYNKGKQEAEKDKVKFLKRNCHKENSDWRAIKERIKQLEEKT